MPNTFGALRISEHSDLFGIVLSSEQPCTVTGCRLSESLWFSEAWVKYACYINAARNSIGDS